METALDESQAGAFPSAVDKELPCLENELRCFLLLLLLLLLLPRPSGEAPPHTYTTAHSNIVTGILTASIP